MENKELSEVRLSQKLQTVTQGDLEDKSFDFINQHIVDEEMY